MLCSLLCPRASECVRIPIVSQAEKEAALADLVAYNMDDLHVYVLEQL